ncbi:family 78 glycoside hydrolase [Cryphonectria parasitica EP155]|uniref:Family 78 glycoside hydrolase n=1 Tax=Cryphonectria parasitica (strain ATCC 38755 / EP155) TaxID=660469 RepID=A0A9P4Y727_CRYP1|nr:family 78 glycoside hydrolase [Cryphonectria parasitica EP155]KAF3767680.1 family 78 glycoside hydrolase [Cryphonectria parasitica EP155]
MRLPALIFFSFLGVVSSAPYSEYILAPSSRTVYPVSVYNVNGTVSNAEGLLNGANSTVTFEASSAVTLDFGKNIAGQVSLVAGDSVYSEDAVIWITFTESSEWISGNASDSTATYGLDEPIFLPVGQGAGLYTVDRKHARGGYRYLSLKNNGTGDIELTGLAVYYTASPTSDLQGYTGYFHSDDELINRVWYAGAYTNQLCSIDPQYGDALIHENGQVDPPTFQTWYYNYTITNGSVCLVDGAKRDTLVWPGDMFISGPSIAYSTYDMDAIKNSMESLLLLQTAAGLLPYVGVPFFSIINAVSFTYHLHNLIGMYNYYHYTGDQAWITQYWDQFKLGVGWSLSNVDDTGLMDVTSSADWLRSGMGGHNIEANAILYYVLNLGIELAGVLGDATAATEWSAAAARLKVAANSLLWREDLGFYVDNETTTMTPQDGNSFAALANLTLNSSQVSSISSNLKSRWGQYGAPAPECASTPATISPFASGFELEAHLVAGDAEAALELMRIQWGDFMLDDPRMTNSTFIEGYSADGSLHYSPYTNDPRVSLAHGWSTGPTSLLSRYVAGIQIVSAAGQEWKIAPAVGDLTTVSSGMATTLGNFTVDITADGSGGITALSFKTPAGTTGDVVLPSDTAGSLTTSSGQTIALTDGVATGLSGGNWALTS